MKWYIIEAIVGKEHQAVKLIQAQIEQKKMQSHFGEILVPEQKAIKLVNGERKEVKERRFPGYVLVKMDLSPETQRMIKGVNHVKDFLGGVNPAVFSESEADKFLGRLNTTISIDKEKEEFVAGDLVQVTDGPFKGFNAKVDAVQGNRLRVLVQVFGQSTSVELKPEMVMKMKPEVKAKK